MTKLLPWRKIDNIDIYIRSDINGFDVGIIRCINKNYWHYIVKITYRIDADCFHGSKEECFEFIDSKLKDLQYKLLYPKHEIFI